MLEVHHDSAATLARTIPLDSSASGTDFIFLTFSARALPHSPSHTEACPRNRQHRHVAHWHATHSLSRYAAHCPLTTRAPLLETFYSRFALNRSPFPHLLLKHGDGSSGGELALVQSGFATPKVEPLHRHFSPPQSSSHQQQHHHQQQHQPRINKHNRHFKGSRRRRCCG